MNHLNIIERRRQHVTVLDLSGKIRIGDDSAKLGATLRMLAQEGAGNILLNMAGVTYIDSSGLGELVSGYVATQKSGGELKLLHLTDKVNDLMTITKLLTVFEVFENEEEAVASFPPDPAESGPANADVVTGKLNGAALGR